MALHRNGLDDIPHMPRLHRRSPPVRSLPKRRRGGRRRRVLLARSRPSARLGGIIGLRSDRLGKSFLAHAHAARLMPRMPSTSSAMAAISRAAGPAGSMRLGVAPQSAASA